MSIQESLHSREVSADRERVSGGVSEVHGSCGLDSASVNSSLNHFEQQSRFLT